MDCSGAGLPIFQLRIVDIDFFVLFVSRAEIVAFFVGEGSQTRPQRAAVHSSFDTEKKLQISQKQGCSFSFYSFSFQKCRCRRFDSYKSEKSSLREDLERAIAFFCLRKQRRGSGSHRNGFIFGPTQCCRDQHISYSDPIAISF